MKKSMLAVVVTVLAAQGCTYYISSDGHQHFANEGMRGADSHNGNKGVAGVAEQVLKSKVPAVAYMARSTAEPVQGAKNSVSHKVAAAAPIPQSAMVPPATERRPKAQDGFTPDYWAGFFKEGALIILRVWAGESLQ